MRRGWIFEENQKADAFEALVGKGLFPEVLPSCFSSQGATKTFVNARKNLENRKFEKLYCQPINYSGTKHTGARRHFATPNPASHSLVSNFIENQWGRFEEIFNLSEILKSRPKFADNPHRAIEITPFRELEDIVDEKIAYSPLLVRADISQFYPSVYTHSIPWAAHGKEEAKKDTAVKSKATIFNELDFHIRNGQLGQTSGILVGPDTSRVVSEFLLSRCDEIFVPKCKAQLIGAVRHVDDYYFGVASESDAYFVLSQLDDSLREFELFTNDTKTKIMSTSTVFDDAWPNHLHRLGNQILERETDSRSAVRNLIDETLRLVTKHRTQSPVRLLLRKFDHFDIHLNEKFELIEHFLLRVIAHFNHAIDYVVMLVCHRVGSRGEIRQEDWTVVINSALKRHLRTNNHHECCWLLWLAFVISAKISNDVLSELQLTGNSHLRAMIIGMQTEGFAGLNLKEPMSLNVCSEHWLEVYEGTLRSAWKDKFEEDATGLFAAFQKDDVTFLRFAQAKKEISEVKHGIIGHDRFGYDDKAEVPLAVLSNMIPSTMDF